MTGKKTEPTGQGTARFAWLGTEAAGSDELLRAAPTAGRDAPGWPIHLGEMQNSRVPLRRALTFRGAVRWYLGSGFALAWLVYAGIQIYQQDADLSSRVWGVALLTVFGLCFCLTPPITWSLPVKHRYIPLAILFAMTFVFVPTMGTGFVSMWTFVGVAVGMSMLPLRVTWGIVLGLGAVAVLVGRLDHADPGDLWSVPAIIVSISMMMAAFARMIATVNQLRATQHEMARIAVEQERGRVARDIHDILGHSLTAITVKAELAGRLIESRPDLAARHINDVEDLSRAALADVRATVTGYRGMNIVSELANARSVLESAGIAADLPGTTDQVPSQLRELFGWVIREAVTNVVRHSGATTCRIRVGGSCEKERPGALTGRPAGAADALAAGDGGRRGELLEGFVEIEDDGSGPVAESSSGNGLDGLRERVGDDGARMTIGRSELGGYRLVVEK